MSANGNATGNATAKAASPGFDVAARTAMAPRGINHVVLNVRDLEESHRFWTELMGFRQVAELKPDEYRGRNVKMRFYSGVQEDGSLNHHDLALAESPNLPPPDRWRMFEGACAINHIAITLPSREAWLAQLEFLQQRGVEFKRRVNHGTTHSLYIRDPNGYGVELLYELPRSVWEGDVDAALNYAENLPTEGDAALEDRTDVPTFEASV